MIKDLEVWQVRPNIIQQWQISRNIFIGISDVDLQ